MTELHPPFTLSSLRDDYSSITGTSSRALYLKSDHMDNTGHMRRAPNGFNAHIRYIHALSDGTQTSCKEDGPCLHCGTSYHPRTGWGTNDDVHGGSGLETMQGMSKISVMACRKANKGMVSIRTLPHLLPPWDWMSIAAMSGEA
jgi:hypothetical protein